MLIFKGVIFYTSTAVVVDDDTDVHVLPPSKSKPKK